MFEYQEPIKAKALENLSNKINTCIAAAPGSGKTYMAMDIVKKLVSQGKKVLILPHATTVLKEQWFKRLEDYGIDYSDDYKKKPNVLVNLPQSLHNKNLSGYDYIIVDEAHEYLFAKKRGKKAKELAVTEKNMVQIIRDKIKPKAILALTGTPSKLIATGLFELLVFSGLDLYDVGRAAPLYYSMFSTSYNPKDSDYNASNDLKSTVKVDKKSTGKALDDLLAFLEKRMKMSGKSKRFGEYVENKEIRRPIIKKIKQDFMPKFSGKLEKTMIIAYSQPQASFINDWFEKKGISSVVSTSDTDEKTENIKRFIEEDSIKILVVVKRGILGFDFDKLVNVVDLSFSKNPDRMYQAMSRVVRKDGEDGDKDKFFFKFVPKNNGDFHTLYMTAALMLMHEEFLTKYNGKNLGQMEIPILSGKRVRKKKGESDKDHRKRQAKSDLKMNAELFNVVNSQELMRAITSNLDNNYEEIKWTSIERVKGDLEGFGPWSTENWDEERMAKYVDELLVNIEEPNTMDWRDKCNASCGYTQRNLDIQKIYELSRLKVANRNRTDESALEEAKQYKSVSECEKKNSGLYGYLQRNNLVQELYDRGIWMKKLKYWNNESALKEAKLYKTQIECRKRNGGLYSYLRKNNIFQELYNKGIWVNKNVPKKIQCIETGKIFISAKEAAEQMDIGKSNIRMVLRGEGKTAGGYTFRYYYKSGKD